MPPRCSVVEIDPSRARDRCRFVALPFRLARDDAPWQPGLRRYVRDLIDPGRNPYWDDRDAWFFLALRGRRVVGRMALVDVGAIPDQPRAAVFAFPDFIDDVEVVRALFEAVEQKARERGATELVGPMNPNIHHDIGIQVEGFEHPNTIFMGYQPPYYSRLLEACAYRRVARFQAWQLFEEDFARDGRVRRLAARVERNRSLRIRSADLDCFDRDLAIFHRLYRDSFADHWGFVPPTEREFRFIAGDIRRVLKPNMALIAEWEGDPVGFVLSIPDFYTILPHGSGRLTPATVARLVRRWRRVDTVRVMIAGVLPAHRHRGIHLPLFYRIAHSIFDLGFRGGEISWVHQENQSMLKVLPLLGARPVRTYVLYARSLAG